MLQDTMVPLGPLILPYISLGTPCTLLKSSLFILSFHSVTSNIRGIYFKPIFDPMWELFDHMAFEFTLEEIRLVAVSPRWNSSLFTATFYPSVHSFIGIVGYKFVLENELSIGGSLDVISITLREISLTFRIIFGDLQVIFLRTQELLILNIGLIKKWRIICPILIWIFSVSWYAIILR